MSKKGFKIVHAKSYFHLTLDNITLDQRELSQIFLVYSLKGLSMPLTWNKCSII